MARVLVACEESQRVCIAFRELGHGAYSCDIEPCSGGHPEWHIQDDVLRHLNEDWDLIIAHPPCTHLACSGARHFAGKKPFEFGHPYTKTTCLWLKGLPKLKPTNILTKPEGGWLNQSITPDGRYGRFNSKFNSAKERSKTFEGIAKAMAEQWGGIINE